MQTESTFVNVFLKNELIISIQSPCITKISQVRQTVKSIKHLIGKGIFDVVIMNHRNDNDSIKIQVPVK